LPTITEIEEAKFKRIKRAIADESNWVSLLGQVGHEVLLSDYIATLPHHLEDGLQPYPSAKVREKVFKEHSRHFKSDVLLIDRAGRPVVVECKRGAPGVDGVRQLGHYLALTKKETSKKPRGILVHGGATKLTQSVRLEVRRLRRRFPVEVLRYALNVAFTPSH
jgi:RecB family endonuclease NucS